MLVGMGLIAGIMVMTAPLDSLAHRSGCHTLHTCPSDEKTYICGDLGYPCNGASKLEDIPLALINVPLVVETSFEQIFGRKPTVSESSFWKGRYRGDRNGLSKMKSSMRWHKENNSTGPKARPLTKAQLVPRINEFFASVYGRLPTPSENKYWISRINDKPSQETLIGAMGYQKVHQIQH